MMSAEKQTLSEFQVYQIRDDFPILKETVHGKKLVYLDNAATTQKPESVLQTLDHYYRHLNANIHRGVHHLSQLATDAFEKARHQLAEFINAQHDHEIIFTRGATEAINLIASSYGRPHVGEGDEILISGMEHHANIVPWQLLCEERKATLKVIPINDKGELILEAVDALLTERTKIVAITYISNALGTVNPVEKVIALAHAKGIPVLVDAAQALPHKKINVQKLDCDFLVFSGHKMFGPTGIGVLYGKSHILNRMPPYQGGGDMILSVTFEKSVYNSLPYKFEAGTPAIAEAIGLGAAVEYLNKIGIETIENYEASLLEYGTQALKTVQGLKIIGEAEEKASVLSFVLEDIHPHDIGTILDQEGIAIRTGHHCAMPVMKFFNVPATARASLAFYNTRDEIDSLVKAIHRVRKILL